MLKKSLIEYESRRNAISDMLKRFCYDFGMYPLPCVGTLVVVDGNVNQYSYIDLMVRNMLASVEQMFRDQQHPFVFQRETVPCQRVMAVLACFENNSRRKMLISPQSLDVNPIKNI